MDDREEHRGAVGASLMRRAAVDTHGLNASCGSPAEQNTGASKKTFLEGSLFRFCTGHTMVYGYENNDSIILGSLLLNNTAVTFDIKKRRVSIGQFQ